MTGRHVHVVPLGDAHADVGMPPADRGDDAEASTGCILAAKPLSPSDENTSIPPEGVGETRSTWAENLTCRDIEIELFRKLHWGE